MQNMQKVSFRVLLFSLLLVVQLLLTPICISKDAHTSYSRSIVSNPPLAYQVPTQADDIRYGYNRRVTDGLSVYPQQVEPTLAVLNTGQILVGWKEADTHDGPGRRVGFAYSTDKGNSFSPNILMTPVSHGDHQSDPWLVKDNQDNAYFVWIEYDGLGEGIGVANTTDGGATWAAAVQASDTTGFDDKETACIDDAGNIYIIWDHFYDTGEELRFTKSTDGGATFQPTITFGTPYIPYLTCTPNGTLYCTTVLGPAPDYWPPDTIWIAKSTNYGASWTSPTRVNPISTEYVAIITVTATDSQGNVYVAFAAGSYFDYEIYVTKSTPGGTNWTTPVQINDDETGMQRMVEMTIDQNDNIHVAWLDARNGQWDIYYSYSDDGGATFHPNVRITSEGTPLTYTRPGDYFTMRTGPDGTLYIVWTDGRGNDQDIYFARQDFENPVLSHIPPAMGFQNSPLILYATATDDDHIARVELHYCLGNEDNWQTIFLTHLVDDYYQAIIPSIEMVGSTIDYYLVAIDSAGRNTTLPTTSLGVYILSLNPLSPSLIVTIIGSTILLIVVIIGAVWYLRRPPTSKQPPKE